MNALYKGITLDEFLTQHIQHTPLLLNIPPFPYDLQELVIPQCSLDAVFPPYSSLDVMCDQTLSIFCVCTPMLGSIKFKLWFTVLLT